jgi:Protein of unknown function (DUF2889)
MPLSPPVPRQLRHHRAIRAEAYERADGLWDIEACLTDVKPRDMALASGVRPKGLPIHELWLRITIDRKLNVVDAEASSAWVPYPGLCEAVNPAYRALIGLNLFQNFRRDAARLLGGTVGCTHLTELCAVLPSAAIQAFAGDVWSTTKGSPGEAGQSANSEAGVPAAERAAGKVRAGSASEPGSGLESEPEGEPKSSARTGLKSGHPAADPDEHPNTHSNDKPPFQLGRCHTLRFDGEAVQQFYPRWYGHAPRSMQVHSGERASRDDGASSPREPAANSNGSAAGSPAGKEVLSNSQTEGNQA